MDYFEGLLLGPQWSDTDYANRKHFFSFFSFGLLVCAVVVLYIFFPDQMSFLLMGDWNIKAGLLIFLFVASPFLSFRYYRFPIFLKIPILIIQACKLILLVAVAMGYFLPMIHFSFADAQVFLIDFVNKTLENSVRRFSDDSGSFSTILGVIAGGLYFLFLFLVLFSASVLIPGLGMFFFRLIQLGYEKIVARFVLKKILDP